MVNKRGITPLIATVLIVGLTIAIAAGVFIFLRGTIDVIGDKGDIQFTSTEEQNVNFEVTSCGPNDGEAGVLDITIQNTGNEKIDCFWVADKSPGSSTPKATKLSVFNLKEGKEDTLSLNDYNGVTEIDLYPCLIESNKVKTGSRAVTATCS